MSRIATIPIDATLYGIFFTISAKFFRLFLAELPPRCHSHFHDSNKCLSYCISRLRKSMSMFYVIYGFFFFVQYPNLSNWVSKTSNLRIMSSVGTALDMSCNEHLLQTNIELKSKKQKRLSMNIYSSLNHEKEQLCSYKFNRINAINLTHQKYYNHI